MLEPLNIPSRGRAKLGPLPVLPDIVMGLDLSLTSSGVAIYRRGGMTTYHLTSPHTGVRRLLHLERQLGELIEEHKPTIAGLEGYSFNSRSRHHSIGEWGGVAKRLLMIRRIPTWIAAPTSIKKFMTGNHQANKNIIPLHLFKRYGIQIEQEDEADAACVSITIGAYRHAQLFPSLTDFQVSALAKIERMG